ncbi:cupin domain-containing protein [Halosimplex sp. TS25]|uniref:cupin domain-containing protein n=1 Tax=Halosimplex rarum TaxID=3396619 RepID=UPI0039ECC611
MSPTKANYEDVDAVGGGLHFLRDELDCENLGVSLLECEPGWEGKPHDHADDGQEEVYVLVEGEATVTVDGEDVEMSEGDALRIAPEERRQIENGDGESTFVLAGAP